MASARQHGFLRPLGIGAGAERLYLRLLEMPTATAADLATASDEATASVAHDLGLLEEHGLVTRIPTSEARYAAAPPEIALDGMIRRQQEALQGLRGQMDALNDRYRATRDEGPPESVEVVTGAPAIAQRFTQLQETAEREVLMLVKPPYAVTSAENTPQDEAMARGVDYRVVYDPKHLAIPRELEQIARFARQGENARAGPPLPVKLAIADRTVALVPLVGETVSMESGALIVHRNGLLDALLALFETCWRGATPLRLSADPGARVASTRPTDQDIQIVSLLLAGLTDRSVAGQLGISVRTIVRRTRSLMEYVGAANRMQLAYEAARRGWI